MFTLQRQTRPKLHVNGVISGKQWLCSSTISIMATFNTHYCKNRDENYNRNFKDWCKDIQRVWKWSLMSKLMQIFLTCWEVGFFCREKWKAKVIHQMLWIQAGVEVVLLAMPEEYPQLHQGVVCKSYVSQVLRVSTLVDCRCYSEPCILSV